MIGGAFHHPSLIQQLAAKHGATLISQKALQIGQFMRLFARVGA
jgi:hypothetical protein